MIYIALAGGKSDASVNKFIIRIKQKTWMCSTIQLTIERIHVTFEGEAREK